MEYFDYCKLLSKTKIDNKQYKTKIYLIFLSNIWSYKIISKKIS